MNYKIIQDEDKFQRFLDMLPETTPDEKYYLSLFARRKYDTRDESERISADKGQLRRVLASKLLIRDKLKQMEVEVGAYKFNNQPIPQNTLAVYITPNPRSMRLATRKSLVKFAELIANDNIGYNPYQEVLSQVQISKSRAIWMDFDFDMEKQPDISGLVNPDAATWVKTRGGFHLLIELSKVEGKYKKTWHQDIVKLGCDVRGTDELLPIPGCCQGGFIPYII